MNSMKKQDETLITAVMIAVIVGVVAVIPFLCSGIIFFWCMIMDDGGKLDNVDKITAVVTENQETLQDIVSQVLNAEYDLDIVIDVEDKEFQDLSSSSDVDEVSFDLDEIYRISEELYIKEIYAYKNSDVDMVIFQTNTYGLSVSGGEKGFLYLEQDLSEDINEYSVFRPYRTHDYSEIIDHWYYFDIFY